VDSHIIFHNLKILAICCALLLVAASGASQRQWTVPATGGRATVNVIFHGDDGGRGSMSLNHAAGEHRAAEDVVESRRPRKDRQSDERNSQMKRSTALLDATRSRSSSYQPQPSHLPVTVATALILLLVLCLVAVL